MWRKESPCALLVGTQTGAATVESSMEISQKIKQWICFLTQQYFLLGIFSKEPKTLIQKNKCTPILTTAFFTTSNIRKQPKCLPTVDEWIKKVVVHLHNRILLSHKKEEKFSFATAWMDLQNIMLNKISQSGNDKY